MVHVTNRESQHNVMTRLECVIFLFVRYSVFGHLYLPMLVFPL